MERYTPIDFLSLQKSYSVTDAGIILAPRLSVNQRHALNEDKLQGQLRYTPTNSL